MADERVLPVGVIEAAVEKGQLPWRNGSFPRDNVPGSGATEASVVSR
jgi:hypothetical protein